MISEILIAREVDMRWSTFLFAALLGGTLVVSPAWAQHRTTPRAPNNNEFGDPSAIARSYQNYLYGVISKVGPKELVLTKTKYGTPQTIQLNEKTKYVHNGKHGSLSQLKDGDPVYVDVKTDKKTGDMLARKVVSGIGPTGGSS